MVEFDDNLNPIEPAPQPEQTPPAPQPAPQSSWTPPTPPPVHHQPEPVRPAFTPPRPSMPAMNMTMLFSILVLIALVAGGFLVANQRKDTNTPPNVSGQQEGLSVSAEGIVYATPDIAKLSVGVQETGKDATTVQNAIAKKMDAIKAKLTELGIEDKDIKTSEFGIYPDYGPYTITPTTKPRSYTGRHILEVTIRDLKKANDVSAAVVTAGANEVQSVQFTVEDPESWYQQARTQAINKAKEKAKQLAKDADIKLGRLLSINEYSNNGPIYYDKAMPMGTGGDAVGGSTAAQPGIEPGSLELRANVTLVYQIR